MANMTINNQSYSGKSISITNGKVIIDGKDVTHEGKEINISVEGNIEKLECDYANEIDVIGIVGKLSNGSGDVNIKGEVEGDIKSGSGDIEIEGNVSGGITTGSGDVKCGNVTGSVKTGSGDIKRR